MPKTRLPEPAPPGTPLYVHLPFCAHKCPYCDFFSVEGAGHDQERLVEVLLAEARLRAPESPRTVFVGGGTPSYLDEAALRHLFDGLDEVTGFRKSASEVTAECNPESLDAAKAEALRALGINRLSVGVQSLDPSTLAFFERPHDPDQALAAVEVARDGGFQSFSVDLIHGAPGESAQTFVRNLLHIIKLRPFHVSAYGLTYEPGTPLHAQLERGEFEAQNEDQELDNLQLTDEALLGAGYGRYEVSNFALSGHECSHNVNYWRNGTYIGVGPSAASLVAGCRSGNARSIQRWTQAVEAEAAAPAWSERLDPRERLGETWWLGLRLTEGVEPLTARKTAGWSAPHDPAEDLARDLVVDGLLELHAGHYRLTDRGRPLADYVGRRFLATPGEPQEPPG
jgi:oxygen-independent coproporphyrinogen-3 oxidase